MFDRVNIIFRKITITALLTLVLGYLSWHLINGKNGVLTYFKEKNNLEMSSYRLNTIEEKRNTLKNKVERLYPKSLDADLLDEQYRRATGRIKPNEFIYFYDN